MVRFQAELWFNLTLLLSPECGLKIQLQKSFEMDSELEILSINPPNKHVSLLKSSGAASSLLFAVVV